MCVKVPWLDHMCAMTRWYLCYDSLIWGPWLIDMYAMIQWYIYHDSLICVSQLNAYISLPPHSHADGASTLRDAFMCVTCVPWSNISFKKTFCLMNIRHQDAISRKGYLLMTQWYMFYEAVICVPWLNAQILLPPHSDGHSEMHTCMCFWVFSMISIEWVTAHARWYFQRFMNAFHLYAVIHSCTCPWVCSTISTEWVTAHTSWYFQRFMNAFIYMPWLVHVCASESSRAPQISIGWLTVTAHTRWWFQRCRNVFMYAPWLIQLKSATILRDALMYVQCLIQFKSGRILRNARSCMCCDSFTWNLQTGWTFYVCIYIYI